MVPSNLEKKLKLNYEEHSHFTLFMNTFSLPSSILSLHLFFFVLLLVIVMFSFVGSDVPQFIQFVLGHEAVLQRLVPWGSPCHRALFVRTSGWVRGRRQSYKQWVQLSPSSPKLAQLEMNTKNNFWQPQHHVEEVFATSQHRSLHQLRGELGPINFLFFLEIKTRENSWIGDCEGGTTAVIPFLKNTHRSHQQDNSSQNLTNR